MKDKTKRN